MNLYTFLSAPLQHCEDAAFQLCKHLKVNITKTTLRKDLLEHPDYPGLTAISDTFKNYGIDNLAIKLDWENFHKLSPPFLAYMSGENVRHGLFAVVQKTHPHTIQVYNPEKRKTVEFSNDKFADLYQGIVLAVEPDEHAGEKDYAKKQQREKRKDTLNAITAYTLPFITLIACAWAYYRNGLDAVAPVIFTALTMLGCILTALLLWYEIDEYNPIVNQICQAGKKVNCRAVLSTKASKIGGISWSNIGFTYFMGMLLSLLTAGVLQPGNLFLLSWINIAALPYIIFSIYYQWQVARQWCLLCLAVQALFCLQFAVAYQGGFYSLSTVTTLSYTSWFRVIVSFSIVFISTLSFMPVLEKAKDSRNKTILLQRLKHNPQLFEALLAKQKAIQHSPEKLGITVGNVKSSYKLIKVCNPYCGPCAQAHPVIDKLVECNDDLQLQIIFTATEDEHDKRAAPAKHLLAIAAQGDEKLTKQALDDWYLAEKKDYETFALKYPVDNLSLQKQTEALTSMREWCDKTKISFTPTFFINGYQLPEIYSVADLKYFLMG